MNIHSTSQAFNADIQTPVGLYMSLRNHYRKVCLLESNDYHSRQDSKSIIGCDPLLEITLEGTLLTIHGNGIHRLETLDETGNFAQQIQQILHEFTFEEPKFNGFFGRIGFEFNLHDETHVQQFISDLDVPMIHLFVFRHILVIDHFTNTGKLIQNSLKPDFTSQSLDQLIPKSGNTELPFEAVGEERAMYTDQEFSEIVKKSITHCRRGDVFQLVVSNAFEQPYFGDDFQVYRQLRRLNPSPYLFYFDFESYRLFGSSPEAQLVIKKGTAEIHPIAGTIPKTGDDTVDAENLSFLVKDEKENAEHTMLVDLARNDLSRDCKQVKVSTYKEVQHFSHVTHLVSKVTGNVKNNNSFETFCHSFPAGTLSGTPKPKALELIHTYEKQSRDFYGGSIGMIGADGDLNMAIVIRSFLSKDNVLHFRAGAGVVLDSDPERETQEVHHKLRALRTAIEQTKNAFQSSEKLTES